MGRETHMGCRCDQGRKILSQPEDEPRFRTALPVRPAADVEWRFLQTYGMADRFKNSTKNGIVLSAVENPVDWPVYSDSVKGNKEEQVYIILKDFNGYVAVRHDKKANVAFADGHVAANNEQELMRFRDSRYYADRNFFSYCK